ncbi:MAG: NADH-quinone oxidoreductase subunit A [Oligoflexia bacterium]|nr:NADH-quinone oxidoreductase subunit A [Oligoflexia bacterium]
MSNPLLFSHSTLIYFAFTITILFSILITSIILILNALLGERPKEKNIPAIKGDSYECGVPKEGNAKQQFSVRYYLIAIIFLLFDVEVAVMFPWALVYKDFISQGYALFMILEIIIFSIILLVGYFYVRLRGGFDWD